MGLRFPGEIARGFPKQVEGRRIELVLGVKGVCPAGSHGEGSCAPKEDPQRLPKAGCSLIPTSLTALGPFPCLHPPHCMSAWHGVCVSVCVWGGTAPHGRL